MKLVAAAIPFMTFRLSMFGKNFLSGPPQTHPKARTRGLWTSYRSVRTPNSMCRNELEFTCCQFG